MSYQLRLASDPYAPQIEKFLVSEFSTPIPSNKCLILDLLTDAIVSSGKIRFGPTPSPESLVAIRSVIRTHMHDSSPIPFLTAWGSEKPNGTGIDIAELCALKTLTALNDRVRRYYSPGIKINVRVEDVSAPHLFYERMDAARAEAQLYTSGFKNLVSIMGMESFLNIIPESSLVSEKMFNEMADSIVPLMTPHIDDPLDPGAIGELSKFGWSPLHRETIDFYLQCYTKLYPEDSTDVHRFRLIRYFSGALARRQLNITCARPEWGSNFLELSFVSSPPGVDIERFQRRLTYRTMPSSITNMHMPPWRAKGYLRVGGNSVNASLATFRTANEYNPFQVILEKDGVSQAVQSDYVVL